MSFLQDQSRNKLDGHLSLLECNKVFFPAGAKQLLLSLPVNKRVFFPCCFPPPTPLYTHTRWFFTNFTLWRPLRKTLTSGLGLTICLWLGPPWFNYWFSYTLAYSTISHEYSSLFIIVINLIFMFSLWCIDWVGSLYANRIFMYFCIKSSIGTRVKLASCKSALTPPPPHPHGGLLYRPF